ncbi:MAG: AAA family ATPase [Actinomycetota bacterium]|nr:AAA family ATPase [Actinomycetota bacterium]
MLSEKEVNPDRIKELLRKDEAILDGQGEAVLNLSDTNPSVYLIVGVNGVGKTTTLAKIAWMFQKQGKKVLIAAADTYRAAAVEQIQHYAQDMGIPVVSHQKNSDPGGGSL